MVRDRFLFFFWFLGRNIAPDEILPGELALDFEGKRDRWNAYDPSEYQAVIDEHKKMEEAKRAMKAERLEKGQEDVSWKECSKV